MVFLCYMEKEEGSRVSRLDDLKLKKIASPKERRRRAVEISLQRPKNLFD